MILPWGALFSLIYVVVVVFIVVNAGRLPPLFLVGNRDLSPLLFQIFALASVTPVSWFLRRIDRGVDRSKASRVSTTVFRFSHGLSWLFSMLSLGALIIVLLLIPFGLTGAGF